MHIVYVTREYPPSLRGGGIASYVKEMAHGLYELGHQVTVIAASDDTRLSSEYDDNGVRVIRLKGGAILLFHKLRENRFLRSSAFFTDSILIGKE